MHSEIREAHYTHTLPRMEQIEIWIEIKHTLSWAAPDNFLSIICNWNLVKANAISLLAVSKQFPFLSIWNVEW